MSTSLISRLWQAHVSLLDEWQDLGLPVDRANPSFCCCHLDITLEQLVRGNRSSHDDWEASSGHEECLCLISFLLMETPMRIY